MFKIYKFDLRDSVVETSYAEFNKKDEALLYCYKLNSVEVELGSVYFYFYYEVEDNCFSEFTSKDTLLEEAKKQIALKMRLVENEKSLLDKASKALSAMEKEAV